MPGLRFADLHPQPRLGLGDSLPERGAARFQVYGVELLAAGLRDIIRSKEAADRPQDRQDVGVMREMLKRARSSRPPSAATG